MKILIRIAAVIAALNAGNAYAECTLNENVQYPINVTVQPKDITKHDVSGLNAYLYTLDIETFASLAGIKQSTILANCTGGEYLQINNPEARLVLKPRPGFAKNMDGLVFRAYMLGLWTVPNELNEGNLNISSAGSYSLGSIY